MSMEMLALYVLVVTTVLVSYLYINVLYSKTCLIDYESKSGLTNRWSRKTGLTVYKMLNVCIHV